MVRAACAGVMAVGLLGLGVLAVVPVERYATWKPALLAGEAGHWFALGALGLALLAGWASRPARVAEAVRTTSAHGEIVASAGTGVVSAAPVVSSSSAADAAAKLARARRVSRRLYQATAVVALVAAGLLLRPAVLAWRIRADLATRTALAPAQVFSWPRLWWGTTVPRAAVTTHVYAERPAAAGGSLRLDLYLPAAPAAAGGHPVLLALFGGGWENGDRAQLPEWNHRLAAQGWAVAAIDYRLAPRFPWPAPRDDVQAALAWLRVAGPALGLDPARVVLFGRSAGGQIAAAVALGAREPDPAVRGVVAFYGPHDLRFAWDYARPGDVLDSGRLLRQYLGGTPAEAGAHYDSASATLAVGPAPTPAAGRALEVLLVHGQLDRLVWCRQSERLSDRLTVLGWPHELLTFPWATHGFEFNPDGPSAQLAEAAVAGLLRRVRD